MHSDLRGIDTTSFQIFLTDNNSHPHDHPLFQPQREYGERKNGTSYTLRHLLPYQFHRFMVRACTRYVHSMFYDTCWWFSFWHYQYQHRKSQAWVTLNVVVLHASFRLFMCCVVFTLPLRSLLTLVYIGTVSSAGWGEWSEASRYVFIVF